MNSKKFLLAAVVVAVIYFLLGGFFYAWLMKDWLATQCPGMSGEPKLPLVFVACLVYGLLMSYTYPIGFKGGSAVKEGIRFGVIFSLIVNAPSGVFMLAFGQGSVAALFVSLIWEAIAGGVLGIITAKIYGSKAAA